MDARNPVRYASQALEVFVIPWKLIDTSPIPGSGEMLRLMQRGTEFSIKLGQNELMNSRLGGSEEALATVACRRIADRRHARILIGGLGMGFTLRAASGGFIAASEYHRRRVGAGGRELGPWSDGAGFIDSRCRTRASKSGRPMSFEIIRSEKLAYDAILADVDNGPRRPDQR